MNVHVNQVHVYSCTVYMMTISLPGFLFVQLMFYFNFVFRFVCNILKSLLIHRVFL